MMNQVNEDVFAADTDPPVDNFEIDGGGMTEDDLNKGSTITVAGKYHLEVMDVKAEFEKTNKEGQPKAPAVLFTCEVLHSVKGQSPAGSKLFHRVYVGPKAGEEYKDGSRKGVLKWALACGVAKQIGEGDNASIVDIVTGKAINWDTLQKCKGTQVIGDVIIEKSDNPRYKDQAKLNYGNAWHPDHPDVASVPKDANALEAGGYKESAGAQKGATPAAAIDDPDL